MKNKRKRCVFCRRETAKCSKDHVPPKGVFGKDRTGLVMITVPCCNDCRTGDLGDAALMAMAGLGFERHQSVQRVAENAHAQLDQSSWWLKELRKSKVERVTLPSGQTGVRHWMTPEMTEEISKSVVRTTIGLISKWNPTWDHRDYEFMVRCWTEMEADKVAQVDSLLEGIQMPGHAKIGDGHFEAKWGFAADAPKGRGVMVMKFYRTLVFHVMALPNGTVTEGDRKFIYSWR